MFLACNKLKKIDGINNFITNNVINMADMFNGCSVLEHLDLSNFDTSNVCNMKNMFKDCSRLKYLNLSNFLVGEKCYDNIFYNIECKECRLIAKSKRLKNEFEDRFIIRYIPH